MGTSLGYIGWLKLLDESGQSKGRTYFGQGHVAFFEKGLRGQTLFAVDGSAVEEGFSGGPAFTPDGILCGVLVEALQYAPKLGERGRQVNALPLVSPIAAIRNEIQALLKEEAQRLRIDRAPPRSDPVVGQARINLSGLA